MRKCIIMSGPSGSGKSTWIKKQAWYDSCAEHSADHFFMLDGGYKFDVSRLSEAHGWCLRSFIDSCQGFAGDCFAGDRDNDIIVVDNTNCDIAEIAPYYSVAKAYGYTVSLVTLITDAATAAKRNVHGVPQRSIEGMLTRIRERKIPRFWDLELVNVSS